MTQTTTTTTTPATLNERELFAGFLNTPVERIFGSVRERYIPEDLMQFGGAFDSIYDFTRGKLDELKGLDDPGEELTFLIVDLEGYLTDLRCVRDDFSSLKSAHQIDNEDDELRYFPLTTGEEPVEW